MHGPIGIFAHVDATPLTTFQRRFRNSATVLSLSTCSAGSQTTFLQTPTCAPSAIKDAVDKELDSLEWQDILRRVSNSDWAAPIVAVPEKHGKFRICGDY